MPLTPGFRTDEGFAIELDRADPLARFRERFCVPDGGIYLDGNSLGLAGRDSLAALDGARRDWQERGVAGWFEGERPWLGIAERLGRKAAPLVGARPGELVATGTTTIDIHALAAAFYAPKGRRTKIVADRLTFPTDLYALAGQLALRGLDPKEHLVLVDSRDGRTLAEDDLIAALTDETALAFWPTALYRSGQLLDVARLAAAARARGVLCGFDGCHSVGAVPHRFAEDGVDFAVFCGYKYLNGGPGAPAFVYVNERHRGVRPRLAGWFGVARERQFAMETEFAPAAGAAGFQISSPGILSAAPLEGALDVFAEAGIAAIREKSLALTTYLIDLADALLAGPPQSFAVGSPRDGARRTGHVALERDEGAGAICDALVARGIVPDFRPPNVIRIAPVALYNGFRDLFRAVSALRELTAG
jgi:kynureninase